MFYRRLLYKQPNLVVVHGADIDFVWLLAAQLFEHFVLVFEREVSDVPVAFEDEGDLTPGEVPFLRF